MVSHLVWMILVLLGVGTTIFAGCPQRDTISPCSCYTNGRGLDLFCNDKDMSLDDLKKILEALNTGETIDLDFYYMNLGTVPTDFFKGFNILLINFSNCKFEQIPDEEGRVLVGLEDTLEELMVQYTIEKHNSPLTLDLSHLNKLKTMHINYNTIPELTDNWFKKGPSSLTHLYMEGNNIEKLGESVFANLPNLEFLKLDENQFGRMSRSMLPNPATHLKQLNLNDNGLESLPEDFLTEMPALTNLDLEKNDFTSIPQETFERIWGQLEYIGFSGNNIDCKSSSLKWIVDSEHSPIVYGLCATPSKRRHRRIRDIIAELRKGDN